MMFAVLSFSQQLVNAQSKQPNVVLILTDDQGWGDLGMHGNPWLETPNIDSLAKQGTEFKNFYVSPLCAPSRAEMLTGRYHLKTGVISVSKGLEVLKSDETTLGELFKANGYSTGIFGKWHNGEHFPNTPNDQGFDEFLGFCAGHLSNYFDTELSRNGKPVKTSGYITDVLADAAIDFIEDNKSDPFFCYLPFNAPHSPFQVPDKYFDKYKAKGVDDELASVYGMLDNMDENVGRILAVLKQHGLVENTIVIFLSDNGPNTIRFNGGLAGIKGTVHEGGVKVPFIIRWPGKVPASKVVSKPSTGVDIYPTLSQLCNLKSISGRTLDGVDLSPLIYKRNEMEGNRNVFTHVNFMTVPVDKNGGGFRDNKFRFLMQANQPELYNLTTDPFEKINIATSNDPLTTKYLRSYEQWFTGQSKNLNYNTPILLSGRGAELNTYEAAISSGLKFKEGHGWAHDWIATWPSTRDSLRWNIKCTKAGTYNLTLKYLCKADEVGSIIEVKIGNQSVRKTIDRPFESAVVFSPDRVVRKEVYEIKEWGRLPLGSIYVPEGETTVRIKAISIKNSTAMELYSLILE